MTVEADWPLNFVEVKESSFTTWEVLTVPFWTLNFTSHILLKGVGPFEVRETCFGTD